MSDSPPPPSESLHWVQPVTGLWSFLKSFDWSEPWLYVLGMSYLILYTGVYVSRKNSAIQIFTFIFLLLTVYMAEDINEYLSKNHRLFTRHQYFDSQGMFISVVMSTPLLLIGAFIAGNWFKLSAKLMTDVKVMQLRQQQRAQQRAQAAAAQAAAAAAADPADEGSAAAASANKEKMS